MRDLGRGSPLDAVVLQRAQAALDLVAERRPSKAAQLGERVIRGVDVPMDDAGVGDELECPIVL